MSAWCHIKGTAIPKYKMIEETNQRSVLNECIQNHQKRSIRLLKAKVVHVTSKYESN
jgi:hypothetical protein